MEFTDLLERYLWAKQAVIDAEGNGDALRRTEVEFAEAAHDLNEFIASGGLRP